MIKADIQIRRKQMEFLSNLKKKVEGVSLEPIELGHVKAEWIEAQGSPSRPVVLYFHGGAYVTGSLVSSRVMAGELAHVSKRKVLSFDYRLAPEHPYPAAIEDAISVYHHLLECGYEPKDILFAGESAGGGLCLATALVLKQYGWAMPASITCLSPWADLTCEGYTHVKNAGKDPCVNTESLKMSALQYAGKEELTSPLVSPIFGDFAGFPPVLIQVGEDEVLYNDAETLNAKMLASHVDVVFSAFMGMWHVWQIYDIREAHEALEQVREFMQCKIPV